MFPDVSESLTPILTLSAEEVLDRSDFHLSPKSTTSSSHTFRNALRKPLPHAIRYTKRTLRDDDDDDYTVFNRMCTRWQ